MMALDEHTRDKKRVRQWNIFYHTVCLEHIYVTVKYRSQTRLTIGKATGNCNPQCRVIVIRNLEWSSGRNES